jgi:hypothetical protein
MSEGQLNHDLIHELIGYQGQLNHDLIDELLGTNVNDIMISFKCY